MCSRDVGNDPCDLKGDLDNMCYGCVITYASMYFSILPEFKEEVVRMVKEKPDMVCDDDG